MRNLLRKDSASAGMIGIVVSTLIAIIIGVLVWYSMSGPMVHTLKAGAPAAHPGINSTVASLNASANTIWTLFPIIAIVLIAGVILAVVVGFGRGQKV